DPAPNSLLRVQKTFSTGPRSFSLKEFWFHQRPSPGVGVQPRFDSRHGRIACKFSFPSSSTFGAKLTGARSSPISQKGSKPTPAVADDRAPKFKFSFFRCGWLAEHPLAIVIGLLSHQI